MLADAELRITMESHYKKTVAIILLILQMLLLLVIPENISYSQMAILATAQCLFLVIAVRFRTKNCVFLIILILSIYVFHCGQILCIGFDMQGMLSLDFRKHASSETIRHAFQYYLFSQSILCMGMLLARSTSDMPVKANRPSLNVSPSVIHCMLIVGVIPRLYYDISRVLASIGTDYLSVFSVYMPTALQALASVFDAGLIGLLLIIKDGGKQRVIFWLVVAYKMIIMLSGARQNAFCFLVIWLIVYFAIINRIEAKKLPLVILTCLLLFVFVDAIGETRAHGFNPSAVLSYLTSNTSNSLVGDTLGEFGSAFTTLVTTMENVPIMLSYGLGRSYIAGLTMIVPGVTSRIPFLAEAANYIAFLPSSIYFGGSMLAEAYYNFGWFGLVVFLLIGLFSSYCNEGFYLQRQGQRGSIEVIRIYSAGLLLLMVRGSFMGFAVSFFYLIVFILLSNLLLKSRHISNSSLINTINQKE